jgi:gamma-glutamylcyclotransferase (GGCT)/AIG2-like uncharacterized protein YtfP
VILFLYGTLLDPGVLARMAGEQALARRMRPARLAGWRRVFLRGTPYPTLLRDPASAVEGAVLRAGDAALARLAAYEGSAYALMPVTVATARGAVRARAWIAPPWRADPARPWPVGGGLPCSSGGEAARRAPHATLRAASAPLSQAPATVAA